MHKILNMKKVKLISFDMWGTLIKSNPEFKKARAEHVASQTTLHVDTVNEVFNEVKHDADLSVEKYGIQFSTISLYTKIAHKLGYPSPYLLKEKCEELFLENLPILMDDTKEVLQKLKEDGYTIVLSSNTLLIEGKTIAKALDKLGIAQYFSDMYFSDQLGLSKPNPLFFKHVQEESLSLKSEITHVGDNLTTDVVGASQFGFNTYQINRLYNETLTSFYQSLTK